MKYILTLYLALGAPTIQICLGMEDHKKNNAIETGTSNNALETEETELCKLLLQTEKAKLKLFMESYKKTVNILTDHFSQRAPNTRKRKEIEVDVVDQEVNDLIENFAKMEIKMDTDDQEDEFKRREQRNKRRK